jgi:hypothetical protein
VYKSLVHALYIGLLIYCAPVLHTSIPVFLSDVVENVQKQTFRILYPENHYDEALVLPGCSQLYWVNVVICMQKDFQEDIPAYITAE